MESFERKQGENKQARGAFIISLENQLQLRTPASMSASHYDTEYVKVASYPPTSIKILPVIQSMSTGSSRRSILIYWTAFKDCSMSWGPMTNSQGSATKESAPASNDV
jgi:hypothetical protein